jgi:tetratricopeptide (TPR) repeat protein
VRAAETESSATLVAPGVSPRGAATARSLVALALVGAAVWLAVMPALAEIWNWGGRSDLAVMVDPLQSRYHWNLGRSLTDSGDVRGGLAQLQRAADLGETEPQLYVDLGDAELKAGDDASARRAYQRALVIDPYYAPARQRLADLSA